MDGFVGGDEDKEGDETGGARGRREGGTGEKCVYDAPERSVEWWIEGGVKIAGVGGASASRSISRSGSCFVSSAISNG